VGRVAGGAQNKHKIKTGGGVGGDGEAGGGGGRGGGRHWGGGGGGEGGGGEAIGLLVDNVYPNRTTKVKKRQTNRKQGR